VTRVNDIADRLNVLLNDENQRKLSNTLGSVERLAQRLVETQDRLAPTLDALPGLTERTRSLLAESEKLAKDLEAVSRDVRAHADAVDRAGRGIEQIGAAATDVSTQTLPHLNRVLARLEHTAENLDRAIEAQARDPGSLLFGAAPPEAGPGEPGFERRKGGGR
jgi:phospholipid/cholesterol/gamma-HCH transport system substrate-binding protein